MINEKGRTVTSSPLFSSRGWSAFADHDRWKDDAAFAEHDGWKDYAAFAEHDGWKDYAAFAEHDRWKDYAAFAEHDGWKDYAAFAERDGGGGFSPPLYPVDYAAFAMPRSTYCRMPPCW
jgi:hypothetical protein